MSSFICHINNAYILYSIYIKKMINSEQYSLFFKIPEELIKDLQSSTVNSFVGLVKRTTRFGSSCIVNQQTTSCIQVKLHLVNDWVFQINSKTNQIVSGFKCDRVFIFKIQRARTIDPNQIGQIIGLSFKNSQTPLWNQLFYLANEKDDGLVRQLQSFCVILATRYITQDGFHDIFRSVKRIGRGVTASVYEAQRETDKTRWAVKSFKTAQYYESDKGRGKKAFEKQFLAMTRVLSPYLVKLISVYQTSNSIYILMQLLTRSLHGYIALKGFPSPKETYNIIIGLFLGLKELHQKNMMHRDIKLQNIMIHQEIENITIHQKTTKIRPVLIDFGLVQQCDNQEFLYIKCGTPGYVAPEILAIRLDNVPKPPYTNKCDIFSLGVVVYALLTHKILFQGANERQVVRNNRQCNINYDFPQASDLQKEQKQLLRKMLQKDPKERPSITQLLQLEFFKKIHKFLSYSILPTDKELQSPDKDQKQI